MALIIPGQSWVPLPGLTAGVHAILACRNGTTATAIVGSGGYPSGSPVNVADRNNTLSTPFPGRTVDVDLYCDKRSGRLLIYVNGAKALEYADADAIPYLSKYGIIEWTFTNVTSPVTPKVLSFSVSSAFNPPTERGTARVENVTTAVTLGTSFADINTSVFCPVVFPPSGQVLIMARTFIQQDAGRTQLRASGDGQFGQALTVARDGAFNGEVTYMSPLNGVPGKRVDVRLQGIHADGGTGTVRVNADVGTHVMAAVPIEPYTPAVES